jgi:uncharacterized membrane protein YphA (DoxX/SURF4 family)
MQVISQIFRYATGLLFIFSGLIKLNDPVGTQIKLEEYFEVFATDFSPVFHHFIPYALVLSVILCVLEVVLGVALLIKYKMKYTMWALLLIIVFFTFLTFYSAYFNKVTDCGCFGDAIKLTPWESFTKDVILLVMIAFLFTRRNKMESPLKPATGTSIVGIATALSLFVAIYAIRHLPPVDFRAYKVGANIPVLMQPSEQLKYRYIMEKDGKSQVFEQYPTDTTYKYKEIVLANPEALPKITDYRVWNDEGDFTEETFKGNKLLIIIVSTAKASHSSFEDINKLVSGLQTNSSVEVKPMVLTSSGKDSFEQFRHEVQLPVPYYFADATVLKTMIRSNPGIILLQNGVVKGQWHYNDVPSSQEVEGLLRQQANI